MTKSSWRLGGGKRCANAFLRRLRTLQYGLCFYAETSENLAKIPAKLNDNKILNDAGDLKHRYLGR